MVEPYAEDRRLCRLSCFAETSSWKTFAVDIPASENTESIYFSFHATHLSPHDTAKFDNFMLQDGACEKDGLYTFDLSMYKRVFMF